MIARQKDHNQQRVHRLRLSATHKHNTAWTASPHESFNAKYFVLQVRSGKHRLVPRGAFSRRPVHRLKLFEHRLVPSAHVEHDQTRHCTSRCVAVVVPQPRAAARVLCLSVSV